MVLEGVATTTRDPGLQLLADKVECDAQLLTRIPRPRPTGPNSSTRGEATRTTCSSKWQASGLRAIGAVMLGDAETTTIWTDRLITVLSVP